MIWLNIFSIGLFVFAVTNFLAELFKGIGAFLYFLYKDTEYRDGRKK